MPEHAVLVHLPSFPNGGLADLEDQLADAIDAAGAGEFDGNEIGPDGAVLFMYGPSADTLWTAIAPALRAATLAAGTYAIKRYGDPGAPEIRVDL